MGCRENKKGAQQKAVFVVMGVYLEGTSDTRRIRHVKYDKSKTADMQLTWQTRPVGGMSWLVLDRTGSRRQAGKEK